MPASRVSRINLDLLYPPFLMAVLDALAELPDFHVTRGFATFSEQAVLYRAWLRRRGGKAAPEGLSAHNYGLAIDLTHDSKPEVPGLQPDWVDADYEAIGPVCQKHGLVWGKSFGDKPHIQWPGFVNRNQLLVLRELWVGSKSDAENLSRVWDRVDIFSEEKP